MKKLILLSIINYINNTMTQEDKELLLKDLCARVPYRTFVCLNPGAYNKPETCILTGVHGEHVHLNVDSDPFRIDHIKPYLRPMSSMTEEEKTEYHKQVDIDLDRTAEGLREQFEAGTFHPENKFTPQYCHIDWLNEHHFDYRGLIPIGLALEAPSNMYKTK
jgi:hypothetical protein